MALKEVTIYEMQIAGTYRVESDNLDDAINKAKEYVEENAGELTYNWSTITAWVEEEE